MARYKQETKNNNRFRNNSEKFLLRTSERIDSRTNIKLRTKRKLLVYKKGNEFFIDKSAAYALKLTNVRAIMLEKPSVVKIDLEILLKMQNNPDIEIEYQELGKQKENTSVQDTLTDALESLEQQEYGIGIHGIDKGNSQEKKKIALKINKEGLNISSNNRTILSTAISLGSNKEAQDVVNDVEQYKFGNGSKGSIVIAVPLCIQNKSGEKIFLGFPEKNQRTAGQQHEEHCILDRICAKTNKIPPEFILGYYYENPDGSQSFISNERHYSNLSIEEREGVYDKCFENMDDISMSINEAISKGNVEGLKQMRQRMQECGMHTYMIDNAIESAESHVREAEHETTIDTHMTSEVVTTSKGNIQRILLDTYDKAQITVSDIREAKGNLAKGKTTTRPILLDRG